MGLSSTRVTVEIRTPTDLSKTLTRQGADMPDDSESTLRSRLGNEMRLVKPIAGAVVAITLVAVGMTVFFYEPDPAPVGNNRLIQPVVIKPLPTDYHPVIPTSAPAAPPK
ncbi:hypothetical protein [Nocardia sp. NPDC057668]|uniref:hypothetical protein n=1 Tax=Nocardia sp. NPDC057668 TaxID=3346202 RepID=UPI003670665C